MSREAIDLLHERLREKHDELGRVTERMNTYRAEREAMRDNYEAQLKITDELRARVEKLEGTLKWISRRGYQECRCDGWVGPCGCGKACSDAADEVVEVEPA